MYKNNKFKKTKTKKKWKWQIQFITVIISLCLTKLNKRRKIIKNTKHSYKKCTYLKTHIFIEYYMKKKKEEVRWQNQQKKKYKFIIAFEWLAKEQPKHFLNSNETISSETISNIYDFKKKWN